MTFKFKHRPTKKLGEKYIERFISKYTDADVDVHINSLELKIYGDKLHLKMDVEVESDE